MVDPALAARHWPPASPGSPAVSGDVPVAARDGGTLADIARLRAQRRDGPQHLSSATGKTGRTRAEAVLVAERRGRLWQRPVTGPFR